MEEVKSSDKRKAPDKSDSQDDLRDESLIGRAPLKRPRIDHSSSAEHETENENTTFPFEVATSMNQSMDLDITSLVKKDNSVESNLESAEIIVPVAENLALESDVQIDGSIPPLSTSIPLENGSSSGSNGDVDNEHGLEEKVKMVVVENQTKGDDIAETKIKSDMNNDDTGLEVDENENGMLKKVIQPTMSSSPLSDSETSNSAATVIKLSIKAYDINDKLVYEQDEIRSDYLRLESFLKDHQLTMNPCSIGSGYAADMDSEDILPTTAGFRKNRWTSSTLGSSIPRESMKTILTASPNSPPSDDGESNTSKRKRGKNEPKLTSTKLNKSSVENTSTSQLSNGQDSYKHDGNVSKVKTQNKVGLKVSTAKHTEKRTTSSSSSSVSSKGAQTPVGTRTSKSRTGSREFPRLSANTNAFQTSIANSPIVRIVAEVEGSVARPVTKFEQEVNNEPVDLFSLQKSKTLWSNIAPNNLVFARWRDKNYYSGIVKQKGLNDTWIIDYDDGMTDVASETHIVPIKILGVGIKGVYTPDATYKPSDATVLGQKFVNDPEIGETVKYAIRLINVDGGADEIWCTRRQLSIKENDARALRQEYMPIPKVLKAAEVSLENIILEPRRRTTGNSTTTTPQSTKKVLGGAFDESTAAEDSHNESKSTPVLKKRGPKGKRKINETSTDSSKSPQKNETSSPQKATKESPKKAKLKDNVFRGYQFFLTASGGGDPSSLGSGSSSSSIPYDKDEYRELIESKGGNIVDQVGDEENKEKLFLISDNYARTVKYIYCLAGLIPCVSYKWIQECIHQGKIVPWKSYQLNSGWSLEENKIIPPHEQKPLKDFQIYITAGTEDLYNYWRPVLIAADAKLLKMKKEDIPKGSQVLVTDATCSPIVLGKAHDKMIPIVKPEWLVQSIISGKKADFLNHEKYRVEIYDSEDEEGEDDEDEEDDGDQ